MGATHTDTHRKHPPGCVLAKDHRCVTLLQDQRPPLSGLEAHPWELEKNFLGCTSGATSTTGSRSSDNFFQRLHGGFTTAELGRWFWFCCQFPTRPRGGGVADGGDGGWSPPQGTWGSGPVVLWWSQRDCQWCFSKPFSCPSFGTVPPSLMWWASSLWCLWVLTGQSSHLPSHLRDY